MDTAIEGYDIIGDLHGQVGPLRALLKRLGYRDGDGAWRYPGARQAIFVGDFVDRNPYALEVVAVVRRMVEAGAAMAVMGNHEFNALGWHTPDPDRAGEYLRRHNDRNRRQHAAFLAEAGRDPAGYAAAIDWFGRLPMWLDLGALRVVHASWSPQHMATLHHRRSADGHWPTALLVEASHHGSAAFAAVETLLKGPEAPLPGKLGFVDGEGTRRGRGRLRWWLDSAPATLRQALLAGPAALEQLPDVPWDGGWPAYCGYPPDAPPVFCGHYWLDGPCAPLAGNIACVDYSAARPGNKLVAYRWNGEQRLSAANFVSVPS